MEILSSIVIKTVRNDRVFEFIMPVGAHYGEAYDAAFEVLSEISKMSATAAQAMKPKESGDDQEVS